MSNFLNQLNKVQQEAVQYINGPSLVIAGAGSGKTRVLTYKIAYLLSKGIPSGSILALTFTNKAAREMKERIVTLAGEEAVKYLWMGTFHSRFASILRYEADKLGYPSSFSIYDTIDSKNVIKQIVKDLNLDEQVYKPNVILGRISAAKNNLFTADGYLSSASIIARDRQARRPETGNIYKHYENRCKIAGAMDFDDLLLNTNILFRDHPDVLEKYQKRFQYILVDEYQDTNFSQYLIVKKLADLHNNVCVVGDDAQSIYSFRGAKIENILNFRKDYPNYKLFKLEQNYRSTQNIVNAANSLIAKNKSRIKKEVFSKKDVGNKVKILKAYTDGEEGALVANTIIDLKLQEREKFQDFAILYRTNAQSRIMEEAMRKLNIPYRIYGGISFYQRKEIKDLIAYFRVVINHRDEESIKRIINFPARGIGKTTMNKLIDYGFKNDLNLWDVLKSLAQNNPDLNKPTIIKLTKFVELIEGFALGVDNRDAYESALQIAKETGILKELHDDNSTEAMSRLENIQELLNGIREFTLKSAEDKTIPLFQFIENVSLLTDQDTDKDIDSDKLTMMTIHASKGLEFKYVFIVGVEEQLFPSQLSTGSIEELEEERRLFYVALTRAEKSVFVSYAKSRFRWGNINNCLPSRFIKDIDSQYIDEPEEDKQDLFFEASPKKGNNTKTKYPKARGNKNAKKALSIAPSMVSPKLRRLSETSNTAKSTNEDINASGKIKVGMRVYHDRFGEGKVLELDNELPNQKVTVLFNTSGQKQLLLKFAKLRILGN